MYVKESCATFQIACLALGLCGTFVSMGQAARIACMVSGYGVNAISLIGLAIYLQKKNQAPPPLPPPPPAPALAPAPDPAPLIPDVPPYRKLDSFDTSSLQGMDILVVLKSLAGKETYIVVSKALLINELRVICASIMGSLGQCLPRLNVNGTMHRDDTMLLALTSDNHITISYFAVTRGS